MKRPSEGAGQRNVARLYLWMLLAVVGLLQIVGVTPAAARGPLPTPPNAFNVGSSPNSRTATVPASARALAPDHNRARRQGSALPLAPVRAERTNRRKLFSRSYALADGSELTRRRSVPQNYRAADGSMHPINTTPTRDLDYEGTHPPGLLTWKTPVGFQATAGSLEVHFETLGVYRGGIRVIKGNTEVKFIPRVVGAVLPELERTVDGQSYIIYRNAFPGADLVYTYTGSGVKEHIRLNGPAGVPQLVGNISGFRTRFSLQIGGFRVRKSRKAVDTRPQSFD